MIVGDVIPIISSFLALPDLVRVRRLSRTFKSYVDRFLDHTGLPHRLESQACPRCGNWVGSESDTDIDHDPTFYDNLYGDTFREEERRLGFITGWMSSRRFLFYKRCRLLCETCDAEEAEDIYLPYSGSRRFIIVECRKSPSHWKFIVLADTSNPRWNEFRSMESGALERCGYDW